MGSQKPILIAGAGLSALLLAKYLHRHGIPVRIFERDASPSFRAQGYRLRLSQEALDAMEEALGPEWQEFYDDVCGKTGGSGFIHYDALTAEVLERKDGEALGTKSGLIIGAPRGAMRNFFMRGLEEHIQWSKKVTGFEDTPDGVRLVFADGSKSEEGAMLVAGEGIASQTSRQVSGGRIKVYDTGMRAINGQAPTTAYKKLGEGVFRIQDKSREELPVGLMTNVRSKDKDDPTVSFGWTLGGSEKLIKAPNNNYTLVGKPAADIVREMTANWHEDFRPLFDTMNEDEAAFWKIAVGTPSGIPEWPTHPRVTAIGDAVHLLTPAGGLGASTAVRDSALLGRLLIQAGGWKDGLTAEYEKQMRIYANEAVHTSWGIAQMTWKISDASLEKELFGPRSGIAD